MIFKAATVSRGWMFDTDSKFTATSAKSLLAAPSPASPKLGIIRYVSLGAPSPSDITLAERDIVFDAGWEFLGLVQHVPFPHWSASPELGSQHGNAAVVHAQSIGYPTGCHIAVDMEGLGNAGAPVLQYMIGWCSAALVAGYKPLPYDGYEDGMPDETKNMLVAMGLVDPHTWWSDYGPRQLPWAMPFALKQHTQATIGGVLVDADQVLQDNVLCFMTEDDGITEPG
jgi:Domain of unknown function (DUF1906)